MYQQIAETDSLLYFKRIDDNENINYNLGAYYFNKGRFVEAIDIFKKSIDLNPRFIDAMINLGSCYGASGNYNEAIVWFTKAYELDPTNKKAINFLAVTYMNMKEPEKAAFYQNLLR